MSFPAWLEWRAVWLKVRSVSLVLMTLIWCVVPASGAQSRDARLMSAITAITLETGCNGCADAYTLRLQRDGVALLTRTGLARLGTQDQRSRGNLSAAQFDALAGLIVSSGFSGLAEIYEDPQTRDGSWATIGVEQGVLSQRVFSREAAGPAELLTLRTTIERLKAQLVFLPAQ